MKAQSMMIRTFITHEVFPMYPLLSVILLLHGSQELDEKITSLEIERFLIYTASECQVIGIQANPSPLFEASTAMNLSGK